VQAFGRDLSVMSRSIRPFRNEPGRDVTKDRPPEFDIGRYYYDQRFRIAEDAPMLNALIDATRAEYDLTPPQWAQWYSVALGFQPDLILELGRSKGNSTAVFCQAASRLNRARVVSLCNSHDWASKTMARLTHVVPAGWFDPLEARIADILAVDYDEILKGSERILLLWDAHGFEIAETVLGRILPLIRARPHLVLMHDISDNRYAAVPRSYEGQPVWKGSRWQTATGCATSRVNLGWMNSLQDQVVAIADFAVRNDIEIGSADHEYAEFFGAHPEHADEMRRTIGDRFYSVSAHWAFLSLTGKEPPFHFPPVPFQHRGDVSITDIHPSRWFRRSRPLPRRIETAPVRWQYAAVMMCRPRVEIPEAAQRSLRLRVRVEGASAGVSLLNADKSVFLECRRVDPGSEIETVLLPIRDMAHTGPVVIHTWDVPESARVIIDDISVVW
jgi:hypothetical protein